MKRVSVLTILVGNRFIILTSNITYDLGAPSAASHVISQPQDKAFQRKRSSIPTRTNPEETAPIRSTHTSAAAAGVRRALLVTTTGGLTSKTRRSRSSIEALRLRRQGYPPNVLEPRRCSRSLGADAVSTRETIQTRSLTLDRLGGHRPGAPSFRLARALPGEVAEDSASPPTRFG